MQIGFIDFSKEERNRVLSTLKLLGDQSALDELGIGTVRDAYADILFPGISTLQTRAKYFVLIPYLFAKGTQLAENGKLHSGREFLQWLHQTEDHLVPVLLKNSPDESGIIGSVAYRQRRSVKIKPSSIYWSGLRSFGILRSDRLSMGAACTAAVQYAKRKHQAELKLDGESYDDASAMNTGDALFLPIHSTEDLDQELSIRLTKTEAEFLTDCISRSPWTRGSLLDFLIRNKMRCENFFDLPEQILPDDLRRDYQLAAAFSRFIYGAHVRYNVIFSQYSDDAMEAEFYAWRNAFLSQTFALDPILNRVPCPPDFAGFCRSFLDSVNRGDFQAMDQLIIRREKQIKGDRAKLCKPEEFRYDPAHPIHAYTLDFRYGRASVIIQDILDGLEG